MKLVDKEMIRTLLGESFDVGRVAAASALKNYQLLEFAMDLECFFLPCVALCRPNGSFLSRLKTALSRSYTAFALVRGLFVVGVVGTMEGRPWHSCVSVSCFTATNAWHSVV